MFKIKIKADRPFTRDMLNARWLLTNRQLQWTGNGHSQLSLAELGKPSPNIDLLRTTGPLTYDLDLQSQASQGQDRPSCQKSSSKIKRFRIAPTDKRTDTHTHAHTRTLPNVLSPLLRGHYAVDNKWPLYRTVWKNN